MTTQSQNQNQHVVLLSVTDKQKYDKAWRNKGLYLIPNLYWRNKKNGYSLGFILKETLDRKNPEDVADWKELEKLLIKAYGQYRIDKIGVGTIDQIKALFAQKGRPLDGPKKGIDERWTMKRLINMLNIRLERAEREKAEDRQDELSVFA